MGPFRTQNVFTSFPKDPGNVRGSVQYIAVDDKDHIHFSKKSQLPLPDGTGFLLVSLMPVSIDSLNHNDWPVDILLPSKGAFSLTNDKHISNTCIGNYEEV